MTPPRPADSQLVGATWVTAGAMLANALAYLLQLGAAGALGATDYGAFAYLLAVQLVLAVPALATQNVAARRLIRGADPAALRRLGDMVAALGSGMAVVAVPLVALGRGLDWSATAAGLLVVPVLVLLAVEQGILQGAGRFRVLGVVAAAVGLGKVVPALVALRSGAGPAVTLAASAVGLLLVYAGTRWYAVHVTARRSETGAGAVRGGWSWHARWADVRAVLWASQVQLVLVAFTSADFLLTGFVLDDADSGRYAFGAVATKVAFWLPVAVGVVLYPRMADPHRSDHAVRRALGILAALGVTVVAGAAVAAPVVPVLVGEDYRPIVGLLWVFAALGAVLSILQGALLSVIASGRWRAVWPVWLGLVVEIAVVRLWADTVVEVLTVALVCAGGAATLATRSVLRARTPRPS